MDDLKILSFHNAEFKTLAFFKILAFRNYKFKIMTDFEIVALQSLKFKIFADFKILATFKIHELRFTYGSPALSPPDVC